MTTHHDEADVRFAEQVLGQRFGCDFRVMAIGPGPIATLLMHGDLFTIGLDELRTVIERGLVQLLPDAR